LCACVYFLVSVWVFLRSRTRACYHHAISPSSCRSVPSSRFRGRLLPFCCTRAADAPTPDPHTRTRARAENARTRARAAPTPLSRPRGARAHTCALVLGAPSFWARFVCGTRATPFFGRRERAPRPAACRLAARRSSVCVCVCVNHTQPTKKVKTATDDADDDDNNILYTYCVCACVWGESSKKGWGNIKVWGQIKKCGHVLCGASAGLRRECVGR
jgi:hypothetical protein